MMREAVIVASSRTPLAKSHRGSFNMTRPDDLAAHAIRHALSKVPGVDPSEVEEVILGCGQPHGPAGHNIARVAALRAGLPVTTAAVTVNRFCNSGLQAVVQAAHMVMHEHVDVAIGGGVESITMMERDSSPNPWVQEHLPGLYMAMGDTAEVVARRYNITRDAQDEYALGQPAADRPRAAGRLLPPRARPDEGHARHPRQEERREDRRRRGLRRPRRVQSARHDARRAARSCRRRSIRRAARGSVTAGNSSQLSDGASATLVMSAERAKALGIEPLLVFRGYAIAGCEPDEMGIGPVFAVPKLLKRQGVRMDDIDVWELNEAFRLAGRLLPRSARHPDGPPEPERRLDRHRPSVRHDRLAPGRHDCPEMNRRKRATASSRCASAAARAAQRCSSVRDVRGRWRR